eukprot:TRINITY_DN19044_c0_g1_i2.p1 TRINITY_DN19044_c0_g1~~TRINITY_DN19044_c0_g1_i2.p1  ORF type:complete len:530 (-),score=106.19 TRINITY_DN19044_c0_g1_i2:77-1666(-)
MRIPVERCFPGLYHWLEALHLDYLIEIHSPMRVMLFLSCLISLSFSLIWLMDVAQLNCLETTPWRDRGWGDYTCLYKLVGGVGLLFMFQHSATALAYFDDTGDDLRAKKEKLLTEVQKQCEDVLKRTTGQAKQLIQRLSSSLSQRVHEHVSRQRQLLEVLHKRGDTALREELLKEMAYLLHYLRRPPMHKLAKLIDVFGSSGDELRAALNEERHSSMVDLLGGSASNARTMTLEPDAESPILSLPARVALSPQSSLGGVLRLPGTDAFLGGELRPLSLQEKAEAPEKSVLRPLHLVLKYLEKLEENHKKAASPHKLEGVAIPQVNHWRQQLSKVLRHLGESTFYRSIFFGWIFSLLLLVFYIERLLAMIHVLHANECHGVEWCTCVFAFVRQSLGLLAMLCYVVSLFVVIYNIDRLDAVLQVQEELRHVEGFRRHIEVLNATELSEERSIALLEEVDTALRAQERPVSTCYDKAWGQPWETSPSPAEYQELLARLQEERRKMKAEPQQDDTKASEAGYTQVDPLLGERV